MLELARAIVQTLPWCPAQILTWTPTRTLTQPLARTRTQTLTQTPYCAPHAGARPSAGQNLRAHRRSPDGESEP
eukprot:14404933-Alexandrium_andersonii.AAC.1